MVLINVDGVRSAIPVGSPKVYASSEGRVTGGDGFDLGAQVIDTIQEFSKVSDECLTYLVGEKTEVPI